MTRKEKVKLGPEHNPGNARWCEEHNMLECTKGRKPKNGGGHCHSPAIRGTDACRLHVGYSGAVARAKGEAKITAFSAVGAAGAEQIDYKMAVLGVLQMTWLRLAAYSDLLRRQVALDGLEATRAGDEVLDGEVIESNGVIGHRYGMGGKDGILYRQTEEIRALVTLEAAERDRVVKYAETAHKMGISDRLTSLAEKWGDVVAGRITVMLDALDLTPEQQAKVPNLIIAHLGSIDIGAVGTEQENKR